MARRGTWKLNSELFVGVSNGVLYIHVYMKAKATALITFFLEKY